MKENPVSDVGNALFRHLDILTTGTTTVSDQSTANTDVIFAGTSSTNKSTLQFIRPADYTALPPAHPPHSVDGLIVVGNPFQGGGPDYGTVDVGYASALDIRSGILVSNGELDITQQTGSVINLNGTSLIDNAGTVRDQGFGYRGGTEFNLDGTLTLGANGANALDLSVGSVSGPGLIRELGKNDSVSVGAVNSNFHVDVRAGSFAAGSQFTNFLGTIGPAAGSNAPTLGPDASVHLSLLNETAFTLDEAYINTSDHILSLLNGDGKSVADIHYTGDPQGLNFAREGYGVVITDHPGVASPIDVVLG